MLEKPAIQDERVVACLEEDYGMSIRQISFLPLGADQNTAVYRAVAGDGTPYFVKLRGGDFDQLSVRLPRFLSERGIGHILAPRTTTAGQLWARLEPFTLILYPYVEGHNGYEVSLSDRQWVALGVALGRIHAVALPPALVRSLRRETYSPTARETICYFLERVEGEAYEDPVARQLATFLQARRDQLLDLVGRAGRLAQTLQLDPPPSVLCHSDMHAGNLLIGANDHFHLVDWDEPILAPKERDLMYVGGGLMGGWRRPQEEEDLFYQGYGPTQVDANALAFYRYERIIQDIAIYCQQILLTDGGGADREQSLRYLMSNFLAGGTLELAYRSEMTPDHLRVAGER